MYTKSIVTFGGANIVTTLTDKEEVIDDWVAEILPRYIADDKSTVVGLDIEWRPHEISSMSNKSATLQLCIDNKCLIVQLFYLDYLPQSLKNFMGWPKFTFVGVEVDDDVAKLKDEYGLICATSKDIQAHALARWPMRWYRKPGLKVLARNVVGLYRAKPRHVCKSDWQARVFSKEQVEYACIDAYASYKIGYKLFMG
ncbi:3'-5' exonuclease-like [Beta vulgaris subsp. vulgaris]|uniref:3'-5' exonuclease-like n=1 Tax=Beta vulgaris subsp. vulgaris TaxID=3555 RepID=UPI00203670DC|nr:3'-5' exonuclease-like [Beta vulgaris subsp. vulgaris]